MLFGFLIFSQRFHRPVDKKRQNEYFDQFLDPLDHIFAKKNGFMKSAMRILRFLREGDRSCARGLIFSAFDRN